MPLGALYILITLLGLSRHPYLLSRNLSAAMAVFAVLAGTGAGRMITFGLPVLARLMGMGARFQSTGSWLTGALAFALLVLALPAARREYRVHERVELTELQSLSETLQAEMRRSDELLVLGCFNEFSNAWVQLLRRRTPGAGRVWVGLPPPVERTRVRGSRPRMCPGT